MLEQGKRIPINQDKLLLNLQKKIGFAYGCLSQKWTTIEPLKLKKSKREKVKKVEV